MIDPALPKSISVNCISANPIPVCQVPPETAFRGRLAEPAHSEQHHCRTLLFMVNQFFLPEVFLPLLEGANHFQAYSEGSHTNPHPENPPLAGC